jgi:hypothetical protein
MRVVTTYRFTVVLVACTGEPSATGAGAVNSETATNGPAGIVGTFLVQRIAAQGATAASTQIFGKVYDGPQPAAVNWVVQTQDGPCQPLVPKVPYCETPCGGAAACVADGVCQNYPTARLAGTVHLTGVKTTTGSSGFDLQAVGTMYQAVGVTMADPPYAEGDALQLQASGSATIAPFTLAAHGIAPLSLDATVVTVQPKAALDLPNEDGVPNHQPDPTQGKVDNHDTLTGTNSKGELFSATATCKDWTANTGAADEGKPRCGHTWPTTDRAASLQAAAPACLRAARATTRPAATARWHIG